MEPTEWYEQATEENRKEKFLFLYANMETIFRRVVNVLAGYGVISLEEIKNLARDSLGKTEKDEYEQPK